MEAWYILKFLDAPTRTLTVMPHLVPASLKEAVSTNMSGRILKEHRSCQSVAVEEERHAHPTIPLSFDLPGMATKGRPWFDFEFDGNKMQLPCQDVTSFVEEIRRLFRQGIRQHDKEHPPYIKLHGFLRIVCLTVPQAEAIVATLTPEVVLSCQKKHEQHLRASGFPPDIGRAKRPIQR